MVGYCLAEEQPRTLAGIFCNDGGIEAEFRNDAVTVVVPAILDCKDGAVADLEGRIMLRGDGLVDEEVRRLGVTM